MKSKMKRVLIVGMVGLMVIGGGIAAFADEVETDLPERPEKAMMKNGADREELKNKISGLSEDIQEQLKELREARFGNGQLAREIIGLEAVEGQAYAKGIKQAAKFAEKFEGKFDEKLDNLRENHPDKAERLDEKFEDFKGEASAVREELIEEREAAREERQARIEELKAEYPDEYDELEENREEMKELREELRAAIEDGDEDEIEDIIDEMMTIIEENKEILESVSDSEE